MWENCEKTIYICDVLRNIYYIYGDDGIVGFEYDNEKYYYEKNQQSDIIGLLDDEFNRIATYTYDAWGKLILVKDTDN